MDYLLDTNILSAYYHLEHPNYEAAKATINGLDRTGHLLVSVVTMAEIDYGVRLAHAKNSKFIEEMRERAEIIRKRAKLPVTPFTAEYYARLKLGVAMLISPGKQKKNPRFIEDWIEHTTAKALGIDENDLWIASQGIERDITVVTDDKRFDVFKRAVPEFKLILTAPERFEQSSKW